MRDPRTLDESAVPLSIDNEVESVAFLNEDLLAVGVGKESLSEAPSAEALCILRAVDGSLLHRRPLAFPSGTLVPFGPDLVLALHSHPRLLSALDGSVALEWPHLDTGKQTSSIIHHIGALPVFAKHPNRPMFAVADAPKITVITVT